MISVTQLLDVFVDVTDTLVEDFDLVDFLHRPHERAARVSGAAAAGLVLTDHHDRVRYMASSNERAGCSSCSRSRTRTGPAWMPSRADDPS